MFASRADASDCRPPVEEREFRWPNHRAVRGITLFGEARGIADGLSMVPLVVRPTGPLAFDGELIAHAHFSAY